MTNRDIIYELRENVRRNIRFTNSKPDKRSRLMASNELGRWPKSWVDLSRLPEKTFLYPSEIIFLVGWVGGVGVGVDIPSFSIRP